MAVAKHPSVRNRRNKTAELRSLSQAGLVGEPPPWPLQPNVMMQAEFERATDRMASLQVEIESAEDGRTKGRLRRGLNKFELQSASLGLQIEQARDAEVSLWRDLWAMPQAVMWAESHAMREVAQYVRWKISGEQGNIDAAKEARMLSDRLGLNPLALLRLRAEVERTNEAEDKGKRRRSTGPVVSSDDGEDPRAALRAVN